MKLLVIEDDDDVRATIVRTLSEAGFSVDVADNGTEGLYRALHWNHEVILLDVMLPGLNGWDLLASLREVKTTPVLMLTAEGELEDRLQGLNGGADDYLVKPYEPRELVARVRALARRATGQVKNEIRIGSVRIDTASRSVFKDEQAVKFTKAQYTVLEYLASRAGAVVTREDLCETLGIENEEEFSNVLNVHIYNIRKRLGRDFLQNKRGQGFIIPADA
ncbi:DNA-binding response regulator [Haloferula helveola]|uniref:DNA-binding response regulator n=1 Tax=Haloferula helveola TaxID=490095 RepID=A0ABM7RGW9_9BACT|nr:DNA-binding response regulator [Haloferula helveola]